MLLHTIIEVITQTIMITFLVIMMMMIIEFIRFKTNGKWDTTIKNKKSIQILMGAAIGMIPGCIGSFTVVSLFTHRIVGVGALLAALLASFGDEALFLYSFDPLNALKLSFALFAIAVLFGFIVEYVPFINRTLKLHVNHVHTQSKCCSEEEHNNAVTQQQEWKRFVLIGCIIAFIIAVAYQVFEHKHFDLFPHSHTHESSGLSTEHLLFLSISAITLLLIVISKLEFIVTHLWNHIIKKHFLKIFIWTFIALLFIDIIIQYIPLKNLISHSFGQIILLFIAILIGFIPQSGPHLIFIFLFLNGMIPFSILLANSIVQEGHGGLPLLAESPSYFIKIKIIKILIAILIGLLGFLIGF
ncbi:MAG: putative manganese transporter [Bacteroidales bacterium]|jgi:hypothetical protein|nr:arsenic efflux protein [Bacteroidales bacterium]